MTRAKGCASKPAAIVHEWKERTVKSVALSAPLNFRSSQRKTLENDYKLTLHNSLRLRIMCVHNHRLALTWKTLRRLIFCSDIFHKRLSPELLTTEILLEVNGIFLVVCIGKNFCMFYVLFVYLMCIYFISIYF